MLLPLSFWLSQLFCFNSGMGAASFASLSAARTHSPPLGAWPFLLLLSRVTFLYQLRHFICELKRADQALLACSQVHLWLLCPLHFQRLSLFWCFPHSLWTRSDLSHHLEHKHKEKTIAKKIIILPWELAPVRPSDYKIMWELVLSKEYSRLIIFTFSRVQFWFFSQRVIFLSFKILLLLYYYYYYFWLYCVACGILVPRLGIEPWPQQWKHWVLTTGPLGNSLNFIIFIVIKIICAPRIGLVKFRKAYRSLKKTQ